eukprot:scaffold25757_cov96-Cyclotella_meneghiniana.AAC.2
MSRLEVSRCSAGQETAVGKVDGGGPREVREDGLVGIREGGRVDGDGFVGRLDGGQFLLPVYLDVPCDYLIFEGRHDTTVGCYKVYPPNPKCTPPIFFKLVMEVYPPMWVK